MLNDEGEETLHRRRIELARINGDKLVAAATGRRATDAQTLTNVDDEDAVRCRAAATLREREMRLRLWPETGGQVVSGLYEPEVRRDPPPTLFARACALLRRWTR